MHLIKVCVAVRTNFNVSGYEFLPTRGQFNSGQDPLRMRYLIFCGGGAEHVWVRCTGKPQLVVGNAQLLTLASSLRDKGELKI